MTLKKHNQTILDQLDISIHDQAITVLLGANGAGKSTLLQALSGVFAPYSGQLSWPKSGKPPESQRIAYVSEPAVFYSHLTTEEQLLFHAGSHHLLPRNAEQALAQWHLSAVAKKKTGQLSLGYRQRLALAQAFMLRPRLLLLDEPMNGMDPDLMSLFKQEVTKIKPHCCVVMASHLLHLMDDWVDHVVVMAQGKVLSQQHVVKDKSLYQVYQETMALQHNDVNRQNEVAS
nr:ATP-binding cassette domain-containing protein [Marinicella rhabdoformis]